MFNINGDKWEVIITSSIHPKLMKPDGTYALGCCDNSTKTIYINELSPLNKLLKILAHEITHAAMFSYNINLSHDQEEIIADLIASYGAEIVDTANTIFSRISKKWGA